MNSAAEETAYREFEGRKVLITGGLGFIGSSLARKLVRAGARVTLVDSLIPEYGGNVFNINGIEEFVRVNVSDVRDQFSLQYLVRDQDVLFNLAGQTSHLDSMRDPQTDLEINCRAQLSILEVCRMVNPGIRIVFASTRQIYGKPDYLPVDERHPIRPVDVNGVNKQAGENYHLLYSQVYGVSACALRLTNTYGPGMRVKDARQTFLGFWVRRVVEGRPFDVFGDGRQLRDFNYVDDACEALARAGLSPAARSQVMNLGSREVISLLDLAQLLVQVAGGGVFNVVPFPPDRKVIDIGDYYSEYKLAEATLGWEPRISLEEGLRRTVSYYRENRRHYWEEE